MDDNPVLHETLNAVISFLNRLREEVIVVILAPHPRYITAPCFGEHMLGWSATITPQTIMIGLEMVDRELAGALSGIPNTYYANLQEMANAAVCNRSGLLEQWKGMVNNAGSSSQTWL